MSLWPEHQLTSNPCPPHPSLSLSGQLMLQEEREAPSGLSCSAGGREMRSLTPTISDDFYFNDRCRRKKAALTVVCWGGPGRMACPGVLGNMHRTESAALPAAASPRPATSPCSCPFCSIPKLKVSKPSWLRAGLSRRQGPACPSSIPFRHTNLAHQRRTSNFTFCPEGQNKQTS